MVGFLGPFTCGAAVVHLRTLRPEYVRDAFPKYKITYVSLVPLVLKNLQKGLEARLDALPAGKRRLLDRKSTRLNSSHGYISYAVFCLKKKHNSSTHRLAVPPANLYASAHKHPSTSASTQPTLSSSTSI